MRIVISSGHGLKIRGAAGPAPWGLDEVSEARRVVPRVAEVMRSMGVEVVTYNDDISDDQSENLNRIVDFHNSQKRDLDVSCHFNATAGAVGCEVWYKTQADLATRVSAAISKASGLKDRGKKHSDTLFFLNETAKPSVLLEVCFVDTKSDCDTYRAKFDPICKAIAESLSGQEIEDGATPPWEPERPPTTPPDEVARPTLKKGSSGPAVVELQRALGVLSTDGDFGPTTDAWVKAFQGAAGLSKDGIVGSMTWAEVDKLEASVALGEPRLPKAMVEQIWTLAQTSEIADYAWPGRGVPPPGYIAGMALCFAYAARALAEDDEAANVMAKAQASPDKCALAWYEAEFKAVGMSNKVAGTDTLRHLFTMMMGLGPRESSGKYCEGRDLSATNTASETAEAGMFQTSWNIKGGSSSIGPLLDDFWQNPTGFLPQFKEGITATASNLDSFGSGDGIRYQFLSRFAPLFHAMVTGVGMRTLRQHWGPINRREVTLKPEADELLKAVQEIALRGPDV